MDSDPSLQSIDILFDSADFITGNTDKPSFNLANMNLDNVVGLQLLYCTIPFSYYVIDSTNNTFNVVQAVGGTKQIFLRPGTYNGSILIQELVYAFNKYVSGTNHYNFFIDSSTAQLVIWNDQFVFGIDNTINNHTTNLGFGTYITGSSGVLIDNSDTAVFGGASVGYIYGAAPVSLNGSNQIFLHSPSLSGMLDSKVYDVKNSGDILFCIPMQASYLGINEYQPTRNLYLRSNPYSVSNCSFYLTLGNRTLYDNPSGNQTNYLSLQGLPFQVGIRFYKKYQNVVDDSRGEGFRYLDKSGNKRLRM